mmetsp:Transcript_14208/g.36784  ORF Transcript_14208/g.36784 Transcript_14208/m.36784 type:complete len:173 (-) Transcript_14208:57-575(-)
MFPHRSWWSWLVGAAAKCVYLFGFVGMTPQLFVNYKLKSVAHLPWRMLFYKAFNTFVDDAFAMLVSMPTAHRIACLRDDVVFFILLYQRWCYPIDRTRANEFGYAYEIDAAAAAPEAKPGPREAIGCAGGGDDDAAAASPASDRDDASRCVIENQNATLSHAPSAANTDAVS